MKRVILLVSSFLLFSSLACQKAHKTATVEIIDGVEFVHNTEIPMHPNKTVTFEEEMAFGGEDENGEFQVYSLSSYTVDKNGNIYICDWGDHTIKVFDQNGDLIRRIGRQGQGPGEFEGVASISFFPNGDLFVIDINNRRNSILTAGGEFLYSFNRESLNGIYWIDDSSYVVNENILGDHDHFIVKKYNIDYEKGEVLGKFNRWKGQSFDLDSGRSIGIQSP